MTAPARSPRSARSKPTADRRGFPIGRSALGAGIGIVAALLVGCGSATATLGASDVSPSAHASATSSGSVNPSRAGSGTAAPGISSVDHAGRHWRIGFDLAPTRVTVVGHPHRVLCGTGSTASARCGSTVSFSHAAKCITVRSVWVKPAVTTKSRIGSACRTP